MKSAARRVAIWIVAIFAVTLSSCRIEPPLKLGGQTDIDVTFPEIITDINIIWEVDTEWRDRWWYGWDERDIALWGGLEYPTPPSYEVRFYYLGESPDAPFQQVDRMTVFSNSFRRRFPFGYHDMVFWSNIEGPVQVVIIDESNAGDIHATTSRSRLSYAPPVSRSNDVYNNPEIFYGATVRNFGVSSNPDDYDYFDEDRNVWVKRINTELTPLVYTYLVQCVIYNNKGRIDGLSDDASISSLADGVSIHTGVTSHNDIIVAYGMRMKSDLPARDGVHADIIGGKLTTFGLCDMEPWSKSRGSRYRGGRTELSNKLMLDLHFSNQADSVYSFDVTSQMQSQAHGGVITIEIDADTLTIPTPSHTGAPGGFDPFVNPRDSVDYEFTM